MPRIRFGVLAFCAIAFSMACAHRATFTMKPVKLELNTLDYNFPSGLRIVFQAQDSPMVSVAGLVGRGSSSDPPGQEGIAHLVEHLWFRSKHGKLPMIWSVHQELGVQANAFTSPDSTTYVSNGGLDTFVPLLRLEALRLQEPLAGITQSELDGEREVVRNELRLHYENSPGLSLYYLREKLFPASHPYHRLGIGTHTSLSGITLEQVKEFVAANYRPENVTITVVGPVTRESAAKALQDTVPVDVMIDPKHPDDPLHLVPTVRRNLVPVGEPPEASEQSLTVVKGRVVRPNLLIAWSLPAAWRDQDALMALTTRYADTLISSKVNRHFTYGVSSAGIWNSTSCQLEPDSLSSIMLCSILLGDGQDARTVLQDALDGAADAGNVKTMGTGRDMRKQYSIWDIQRRFFGEVVRSSEVLSGMDGVAVQIAQSAHFSGDPAAASRLISQINATRQGAVVSMAFKYLNRNRFAAVLIEPYADNDVVPPADSSAYLGHAREPALESFQHPDALSSDAIRSLVSVPPLGDLRTFKLKNGLEVAILRHGSAPLVRSEMLFRGGGDVDPKPGLDLASRVFIQPDSVTSTSAGQIGAAWSFGTDGEHYHSVLNGPSGNLEDSLYLLRDQPNRRVLDTTWRGKHTDLLKTTLEYQRTFPSWWVENTLMSRLLPEHPLARVYDDRTVETIDHYREGEMRSWLDGVFRPDNAVLVVVGNLDATKVEAAVRSRFSDWNNGSSKLRPVPLPPPPPLPTRQVLVLDQPTASLTQVELVCRAETVSHENYEALQVLEAVLDERAWARLRGDAAATYNAEARMELHPGVSIVRISTAVTTAASGMAVQAFLDLTSSLGSVDSKLVAIMKSKVARRSVLEQQTNQQMARWLSEPYFLGLGWDFYQGYAERLSKVAPGALAPLAAPCAGHEIVVLLGPGKEIESQLELLKIPFEVVDWRGKEK